MVGLEERNRYWVILLKQKELNRLDEPRQKYHHKVLTPFSINASYQQQIEKSLSSFSDFQKSTDSLLCVLEGKA